MNTPDVFKRVEYKYLLSPRQFDSPTESLADKIRPDEFGGSTISSLYYDTRQFAMINRSLEKPVYKEKPRIRAYGTPEDGDPVYVEPKKKFRGVVYKRRVPLTANAAYAFMGGVSYRSAAQLQVRAELPGVPPPVLHARLARPWRRHSPGLHVQARVLQELRRDLGATVQRRQAPSRPRRKPPRRAGSSPKGQAPRALFGTGRLARLDDMDERGFV